MNTGMNIKIKRIVRGYKQGEFAKKIGISPQTLNKIENGDTKNPSIETMKKISEILDISVEKLFFEK